jgi:hypothetical protein
MVTATLRGRRCSTPRRETPVQLLRIRLRLLATHGRVGLQRCVVCAIVVPRLLPGIGIPNLTVVVAHHGLSALQDSITVVQTHDDVMMT